MWAGHVTLCRHTNGTVPCRFRSRRRHWPHFHTACQHVVWEWVQSCRHTSISTVPLSRAPFSPAATHSKPQLLATSQCSFWGLWPGINHNETSKRSNNSYWVYVHVQWTVSVLMEWNGGQRSEITHTQLICHEISQVNCCCILEHVEGCW